MRILYGVCGMGFGHSSIASEVIPFLEKKGHIVKVVTYERGLSFLSKHDIFPVDGLVFRYDGEGIKYLPTIYINVKKFPKNILRIKEIQRLIDDFKPDLCITDNEPVVAMISYWWKLPLISFSALNTFRHKDIQKPLSKKPSSIVAKAVTRSIVPRADKTIALSLTQKTFTKMGVVFTSPIIRRSIIELNAGQKDFILVYLADSYSYLIEAFEKMHEQFVVYGMGDQPDRKNVKFKKNPETFATDLGRCKAVISSAGFSVIAEAIYLRKPIFLVPVKGQYEQFYDCLVAKKKNLGEFSENPNLEEIQHFLKRLEFYKNRMQKINYNPDEPLRVLEKVVEKAIR